MGRAEPGKHLEVHLTDADRVVRVTVDSEPPDDDPHAVADSIVRALDAGDPGEAEDILVSSLNDYGTVRRGP